jgi:hypothetical protein
MTGDVAGIAVATAHFIDGKRSVSRHTFTVKGSFV